MSYSMEFNDFRVVSSNTVYRKQSTSGIITNGTNSTRMRYTLGEVSSTNIVLDVNVGNGWTRIKLKEVPKFIVHAFNMITKFGMDVDGIFRKEGNSARLNRAEVQNIYKGLCDIPNDYTVIDVCTLVKRFLRDLKPPLLDSEEFRTRLMKRACQARISGCFSLSREDMAEISFSEKTGDSSLLSEVHFSTLGYVMRQLNRISAYSDQHKMSADNLAVVLVGSVFGDKIHDQKKIPQTRRCSQDDILARKKQDMNDHVAAVKLLIINANLIGVRKNPYITSNAMQRSSSAMPTMRCMSSGYETASSDADMITTTTTLSTAKSTGTTEIMIRPGPSTSVYRRDSEAVQKIVTDRKKMEIQREATTKKKRSSSFLPSLRGIKHRFSKRAKSPSPDRMVTGGGGSGGQNNDTNSSSDQVENDDKAAGIDRQRHAKVARNESLTLSTGSTTSGRQSRSQQSRRGNTNAMPRSRPPTNNEKVSLAHLFDKNRQIINEPLRRLSQSEQNTENNDEQEETTPRMSATEFILSEYKKENKNKMKKETTIGKEVKETRRMIKNRRHTAPVNNGLRRHRPNTVGAGLPHRRATMKESSRESTSVDEKENKNSETDDTDDSMLNQTAIEAKMILEQKGMESRQRRIGRKTKGGRIEKEEEKEEKEDIHEKTLEPCETSSESSMTPLMTRRKDLEIVKNDSKYCDMATSPMLFDSPLKQGYEHGHAWVGDKQVYNYTPSPSLVRRSSRTRLSYAKANESSPVDMMDIKPRRESMGGGGSPFLSPVMKHIAITNNSPPAQVITTLPRISSLNKIGNLSPLAMTKQQSFDLTMAPPVPPHSPPQSMTPDQHRQKNRPPTPPSHPRISNPFSPKLSRVGQLSREESFECSSFSNATDGAKLEKAGSPSAAMFKMPSIPIIKANKLSRQSLSSDQLMSPNGGQKTNLLSRDGRTNTKNTMSPKTSEFFGFGKYTNLLRDAENDKTLAIKTLPFESRPSVAIIRTKNCGLVKSRVNQFQEIEQLSKTNDGRSSRNSDIARSSDRLSDVSDRMTCGADRSVMSSISVESITTPTATEANYMSNRF